LRSIVFHVTQSVSHQPVVKRRKTHVLRALRKEHRRCLHRRREASEQSNDVNGYVPGHFIWELATGLTAPD
jgi:hypothetical protein